MQKKEKIDQHISTLEKKLLDGATIRFIEYEIPDSENTKEHLIEYRDNHFRTNTHPLTIMEGQRIFLSAYQAIKTREQFYQFNFAIEVYRTTKNPRHLIDVIFELTNNINEFSDFELEKPKKTEYFN